MHRGLTRTVEKARVDRGGTVVVGGNHADIGAFFDDGFSCLVTTLARLHLAAKPLSSAPRTGDTGYGTRAECAVYSNWGLQLSGVVQRRIVG